MNSLPAEGPSTIDCAYSIRGRGPTVVMAHGIGSHMQAWTPIVDRLAHEFCCVTFDLRGHGGSARPTRRFGMAELVADLEALRHRLELNRFHLVGHSLGAMLAASYARSYPSRVRSLGLLSTAAFRSLEDKAKLAALVAAIKENGLEANFDHLLTRWYTDHFLKSHPEFIAQRKRYLLSIDQNVLLNVFEIYAECEMGPWLKDLHAPALVVTGEHDPGCNPRLNRLIAEAIPSAQLLVLEGLKHSILVEGAAPLSAALRQFLHSLPE